MHTSPDPFGGRHVKISTAVKKGLVHDYVYVYDVNSS